MNSAPNSRDDSSAPKSEAARVPETSTERVDPAERISGEGRIVGSPRVGERPPYKESDAKPAEPDLRHRVCPGGLCKEPEPKPVPPESDLRHRICLHGPCTCPSGQTMSKNGCVATTVTNETPQTCGAGQYWSGSACVFSAAECTGLNGSASGAMAELYSLKARVGQVCGVAPSSQECAEAKAERNSAIQRYRMLLSGGPSRCVAAFPDPSIFSADFP